MCGILGWFGTDRKRFERALRSLDHRGPDASGIAGSDPVFGHTRLAIMDLDHRSDQPFRYGNVLLTYNGELWNYKTLRSDLVALGRSFTTTGDTEVAAAALNEWGADALDRMQGMFALAWTTGDGTVWLARDRFGEVPLHVSLSRPAAFASERRALLLLGCVPASIGDVGPGEVMRLEARRIVEHRKYYEPPIRPKLMDRDEAAALLRERVLIGCRERAMSDVPVCTLLSGGVDSAVIAYGLRQVMPQLVAYTAVYNERSPDRRSARAVAEWLGIKLVEVKIPCPTADDLRSVVSTIEMDSKAQVEIGWPCRHLANAMAADGYKVTFSGEGSDELWASYGFAYHGLQKQGWHTYRRDLFLTQARRNFPRTNKVFLSRGIEARLPFLHTPLVEHALSLTRDVVQEGPTRPKAVLQQAFEGLLPSEITRRPKLAFQDGLGIKTAIAEQIADPARLYKAEYRRLYGSAA